MFPQLGAPIWFCCLRLFSFSRPRRKKGKEKEKKKKPRAAYLPPICRPAGVWPHRVACRDVSLLYAGGHCVCGDGIGRGERR
jgi:hypothetical protein